MNEFKHPESYITDFFSNNGSCIYEEKAQFSFFCKSQKNVKFPKNWGTKVFNSQNGQITTIIN